MQMLSKKTAIYFVLAMALGGPALATPSIGVDPGADGSATAPIGWLQFCRSNPEECDVDDSEARVIHLTEKSWRRIVNINADVNRDIEPMTDMEQWGIVERWSYPDTGRGDCEDYVLEKRRRLIQAGFPRSALLITVVRDRKGDGHAILTVRTDRGDFVLDNQVGRILETRESGYRFVKRQAQSNPNRWVALNPAGGTSVVAGR